MSISSTQCRSDYVGNGLVSSYAYSFKIFNESDLLVTKVDTSGVETTLALTTDYTLTGVQVVGGGIVTLVAGALPSGYGITIRRKRALTQPISIRNQGEFYAATHEDTFDTLCMSDQQQEEEISRSVKLSETDIGFNPSLPTKMSAPENSGKAIVVNSLANGFTLSAVSDNGVYGFANKSLNFTLSPINKNYFVDVSTGNVVATLPIPSANPGIEFFIKNISFGSLNSVSVIGLIDGGASDSLSAGEGRTYVSNGLSYYTKS